MLQDSFFPHWIFKESPCIAAFEWVLRCPNSNLIIVYCMEWIIFWTSAGQKYSLCRSLRLVSLLTWSVVAQLVVAANIIWEAWVRIPSDPGFSGFCSFFYWSLLEGIVFIFFIVYCLSGQFLLLGRIRGESSCQTASASMGCGRLLSWRFHWWVNF